MIDSLITSTTCGGCGCIYINFDGNLMTQIIEKNKKKKT